MVFVVIETIRYVFVVIKKIRYGVCSYSKKENIYKDTELRQL